MKAIVIGATGLVGGHITKILLTDPLISKVQVFSRRPLSMSDDRLKVEVVDFEKMDSWKNNIRGDVLFSALGTTVKDSGTKAAQYRVDHDYQFEIAQAAARNGVSRFVLISSVNADSKSHFFYLRMKGELEEKVVKLGFQSISILRPGPLKGHREKSRLREIISTAILDLMPKVLVTPGARPVDGEKVAEVAVKAGLYYKKGIHIIGPRLQIDPLSYSQIP